MMMGVAEYIAMRGESGLKEPDCGLKGNYYELPPIDFADEIESLSEKCFYLNMEERERKLAYICKLTKEQRKKYREEKEGERGW